MNRTLRRILFPRYMLWFGLALVAAVAVVESYAVFTVTTKLENALSSANAPSGGFRFGGLVAMFILAAPATMWMVMNKALADSKGWAHFVRHLPTSETMIYRAKIRFDLAITLLPVFLTSAIMFAGGVFGGVGTEVLQSAWHVFAGYLLGYGIFHAFQYRVPRFQGKAAVAIVLGLLPLVLAVIFKSLIFSSVVGVVGIAMVSAIWKREPKAFEETIPTGVATLTFDSDPQAESAPLKQGDEDGKKVMGRWLRRHTLTKASFMLLAYIIVEPVFFGQSWNYSGFAGYDALLLFFAGTLALSSALVQLKLQHLPLSKNRVYPYLVLPPLIALLIGVFLAQIVNYYQLDAFQFQREKAPIRFAFDSSVVADESRQQVVVPPQMLSIVPGNEVGDQLGIPLLYQGGPTLINPYGIGEYKDEMFDPARLASQLERAVNDFYGSSPSAEWIRETFINEYKNSTYFDQREFKEWQIKFAEERSGQFQTQSEYWRSHLVSAMPARILGWVISWALVMILVFNMRYEWLRRKAQIWQRILWVTAGLSIFLVYLFGGSLLYGTVQADGFQERLRMLPVDGVNKLLPDQTILAWVVVAMVTVALYYGVRFFYRSDQFAGFQAKSAKNPLAYKMWSDL
jgi:hypothetical protein